MSHGTPYRTSNQALCAGNDAASSFVPGDSLSLCVHVGADVAAFSILMAINTPRVHVQGCSVHALESVLARICREAGRRVRTNLMVRHDVPAPDVNDGRLEVVVDGLPLRGEG